MDYDFGAVVKSDCWVTLKGWVYRILNGGRIVNP